MRPTIHRAAARAVRAAVVIGAVLTLAALCAAAASAATAAGNAAPRVQMRALSLPAGLTVTGPAGLGRQASSQPHAAATGPETATPAVVTLDAGRSFTMVGLVSDAPPAGDRVTVHVRASRDGDTWGPWLGAELELNRPGATPQAYIEPLWTGDARYVQVSAFTASGPAPRALSQVRVVAIESVVGASVPAPAPVAARLAAPAATAVVPTATPTQPPIVTRKQWGADESWRRSSPSYAPVKMAFVHHTDNGNDYTQAQAPALVRGIYAYHARTLGWNDVGYNFLIDRFGTVYEGRYGGITRGVVGAQVLGFNTGSTGVSIMGTFSKVAPPVAAVTALEQLLAWKLSLSGLDPMATARLACDVTQKFKAGSTVTFPVIAGHRDANYTDCPGNQLYALLPAIRSAVATLMDARPAWQVTLDLSTYATQTGSSVTFAGTATTPDGAPALGTITVQKRAASGGPWIDWRTAQLTVDGTYSLAVTMTNANTWVFRARMARSRSTSTGYSLTKSLTVERLHSATVTLALSAVSVTVDTAVNFAGAVRDATGHPGSGTLTLERRPAAGGPWKSWRTVTLSRAGSYSITVTMTHANSWDLRAGVPGSAGGPAVYSPTRSLTVQ